MYSICIEGERVEQVEQFVFLGSLFTNEDVMVEMIDEHDRDIERYETSEATSGGGQRRTRFSASGRPRAPRENCLKKYN
ncbi:hypothetical protein EVAR_66047_1 [Eumeta japonica]|uniref:Uncharacterized protein n=1 Tax=Eumeta variegata TaxID=151549 RepID=A0A4C2ABR6_EUMVA|nr:hypothetical protein EVAR_66047_1 [Eumeta japonica]